MNDDMQSCDIGINENEDNTQVIPRCVWRVPLDLQYIFAPENRASHQNDPTISSVYQITSFIK